MDNILQNIKYAGAGLTVVLTFLYGGFDMILGVLLAFVIIDYISGVLGAIFTGTLSSAVGYRGIIKKVGIFLIVSVGCILAQSAGMPELRSLVIGFYIANEGISIIENWGRMGLPLPPKVREMLEQLKK